MKSARSHTLTLIISLVLLVGALGANWHVLSRHPQRSQLNRVFDDSDMKPSLALVTFALGPLRGLIADVLWWRAQQMQDRGDFFEAIQLADWISKLQPTMAMVWAYHGWNMASNIVNEVQEPDERWKWVDQGIRLMRDDGLGYNPGDPIIRRELASIYRFRIGGRSDPFSAYYRKQLALSMQKYFKTGNAEEIISLSKAPATLPELRERPVVQVLLDSADAVGVDLLIYEQFSKRADWTDTQRRAILVPLFADALKTVDLYHRRRLLKEEANLDADRLALINKHYGPFDWRLWHGHSVYWAAEDGLPGYEDVVFGSGLMENTFIQQSMVESFRDGRLIYMSDDLFMTTNNLEIAQAVHEFMHFIYEEETRDSELAGREALFKDFHETAAVVFYTYGYEKESRMMYGELVEYFFTEEQKKRSNWEAYVATRMQKLIHSRDKDSYSLVQSTFYQAYLWIALGDSYKAEGFARFAQMIYDRHQAVNKSNEAKLLPPIDEIRRSSLRLAVGPLSTLPVEIQTKLKNMVGEGEDLTIKGSGKRPTIDMGHQH